MNRYTDTPPRESMPDRSVSVIFERFTELAARVESGQITVRQFVEYSQLNEVLCSVADIMGLELRQHVGFNVN